VQAPTPPDLKTLQEGFNLRIRARDLCSDAGVLPNKTLRKALDACSTEKEMSELIEEFKSTQTQQRNTNQSPRSASPPVPGSTTRVQESRSGDQKAFDDSEEARKKRVAGLRR
jgi:hypothetical protein